MKTHEVVAGLDREIIELRDELRALGMPLEAVLNQIRSCVHVSDQPVAKALFRASRVGVLAAVRLGMEENN
ncbi:MAG: hypothetical protein AAGI53_09600 [Planctomycetota bacterium]